MAAKRKPCKAGKVRRAVKGGRKMCLPKKKKAAGKKRPAPKRRMSVASGKLTTWAFNWKEGGYNTVSAKNRADAERKAKNWFRGGQKITSLHADLRTLRPVTYAELQKIDRSYGMWD